MEEKDRAQGVAKEPITYPSESNGILNRDIPGLPYPIDGMNNQKPFSPLRFIIITIGGIFLAEVFAMIILTNFSTLPYYLQTLIDASIMITLIFPVIYIFSLKPLLLQIEKRQRMETSLRQSEERFVKAFHFSPAALSITRCVDGSFINVNESFLRLYGSEREGVIGHSSIELGLYVNLKDREEVVQRTLRQQSLGQEGVRDYPVTARIESGEIRDMLVSTEAIKLDSETCIISSISDITERKRIEERLRRLNHALSVLNECNQVLVRAENETELLQQMCEIIVSTGGYRMAWVGFAEQDSNRSVQPVAQFGFEEDYLDHAQITWADNEWGHGPTGTAIREGIAQVNQNFLTNPQMAPWREAAIKRGYQSSIAMPLKYGNLMLGALAIYAAAPDAFDSEEVHLLIGLANDLAYGICALRESTERKRADEKLRNAYDDLELRVQERTKELRTAISELEAEIAERKRAEEALRKNEATLRGILDATTESIWLFSPDGIILMANETALLRLGKPAGDVIGENFSKFMPTVELTQSFQAYLREVTETGKPLELVDQRAGIIFHHTYYPVKNTDRRVIQIVAFSRDITAQKQAEEALRLSEMELKLAQEVARIGNWKWNLEKGEITWSDEMYRIFGIDKNSYTGRLGDVISRVIHPDDLHLVLPSNAQSFAGKEPVEYRIILPDKSIHYIWAKSGEAIVDSTGKPIFLTGIAQDITERKKMDEALTASEEKYRLLLQYAPTAIYEIDLTDLRFKNVNEATCQLTGYSAEELLSMNPLDFLDEESKNRFNERVKRLLAGEQVEDTVEYKLIDKLSRKRWIMLNVKLTYKDGVHDSAQVVGHDVTERIQMEEHLRAANEELTRFNRAMVGRELRMIDLKKEVNNLCSQSGETPRYVLNFDKGE